MSIEWFYFLNGRPEGPYSEEELKEILGKIPSGLTTPIWHEGMKDWQTASNVESFKSKTMPPPIPQRISDKQALPPPIPTSVASHEVVTVDNSFNQTQMESKSKINYAVLIFLVIIIAGIAGAYKIGLINKTLSSEASVKKYGDFLILSGNISKNDKYDIYYMNVNKDRYLLREYYTKSEKSEVRKALMGDRHVSIIAKYERVVAGPNTGQINVMSDGTTCVEALALEKQDLAGITTGKFLGAQCGDSCFITYENTSGEKKDYYFDASGQEDLLDNSQLIGKKIYIYWRSLKPGQRDSESVALDVSFDEQITIKGVLTAYLKRLFNENLESAWSIIISFKK